jgi:DNA-binding SARP family transcriptional activator
MQPRAFGFGRLRLENNQQITSSFPTKQVEELLGYLVLHKGVNHSREKIINLLWPNFPIQSTRSRLSTVIWRLKSVFQELDLPPDDYLRVTRDSISLPRSAPLQTDIAEFAVHLAFAGSAVDEDEQVVALGAALRVYQGDLFEGLYSDWCLLEREHLYRLHLRAMGRLMAIQMRREEYEAAIDLGEQILGLDPLREEVHRALMRCQWKMGRHALAIRQFERCAELLQQELGIPPMAETAALYATIVQERFAEADRPNGARPLNHEWTQAVQEFRRLVARFDTLLTRYETAEQQSGHELSKLV